MSDDVVAAVLAEGPRCGPYTLGRWSDFVQHVDPCDCDLDDEVVGERCMDNSDWTFAVFSEGGAFAERLVCKLPRTPPEDDDDGDESDDVAAVLAATIGWSFPSDWLTDDYHAEIGTRVLAALAAAGYAVVKVPEGVAVAHGARLVQANSWLFAIRPAIEDTP